MWKNDCKALGHPKYINETGSTSHLFGVWNLRRDSDIMCICEGELDVIACWSVAGLPAVGVSGVHRWRPYWRLNFNAFNDVVILRDGDDAGKKFSERVSTAIYNARVVPMPPGHDVNSFVHSYGPQALRDKVGIDATDRCFDVA
jgi:DNA primase